MSISNALEIALKIWDLGEEVRKHLGCGFNETIYQNALAIELRGRRIEYLREVNIEIFYKNTDVGTDRPDFILTKVDDFTKPIILELKAADRITDDFRIQLKSYCKSLPKNNNPILANCHGGILMAFPKGDVEDAAGLKLFVVDRDFNVLRDDQLDEDRRLAAEKEQEKLKKAQLKQDDATLRQRRKETGFSD